MDWDSYITDRESRCTVVTKGDIEMRVHGQGELDRETIEALRDVCAAAYRRLSGEPTDAIEATTEAGGER